MLLVWGEWGELVGCLGLAELLVQGMHRQPCCSVGVNLPLLLSPILWRHEGNQLVSAFWGLAQRPRLKVGDDEFGKMEKGRWEGEVLRELGWVCTSLYPNTSVWGGLFHNTPVCTSPIPARASSQHPALGSTNGTGAVPAVHPADRQTDKLLGCK